MKITKNRLIALLALVAVTAAGIAWQQFWKAARLQAAASGYEDNADLQRRLAAAEKHARELADQIETQRTAATEAATDGTAGTGGRGPGQNGGRGGRGGRGDFAAMNAIRVRPEAQRLRVLQQKAALDSRFAPLFKALNVSPQKLDQLKTLLAERESTMQDTMMAARDQGIDPRTDPEGFRKLVTAAQSETNTQLKSLLGDEGFAQYEQYAQTQPQRATVDQLRQSLSYTSEPLTDTQASQLVQILAANGSAPQNGSVPNDTSPMPPSDGGGRGGPGGGFGVGGGGGPGATITTAAVAQSQTVLSTTQVQALAQLQALQQAQQDVQQLMRNSGVGPGAGGGTPTRGGRNTGGG